MKSPWWEDRAEWGAGLNQWEHREETRLHKGTRALSEKGGSERRLWET